MSRVAEIIAFVSIADGALAPEVQARAIRARWPEASAEEICEALERSAAVSSDDADAQVAVGAAVASMLRQAEEGKCCVKPNGLVRGPFRRHP